MRENFIDEKENIQDNNINDEGEKVPLIKEKNKILHTITIKIEKNLNKMTIKKMKKMKKLKKKNIQNYLK